MNSARTDHRLCRLFLGCAIVVASVGFVPSYAGAAPAVAWRIDQTTEPTILVPGESPFGGADATSAAPKYHLTVVNAGGAAAEAVSVTDTLPVGLVAASVDSEWIASTGNGAVEGLCSTTGERTVNCVISPTIQPGAPITILIPVEVGPSVVGSISNEITVSSAGTPPASRTLISLAEPRIAPFALEGAHGLFGGANDEEGETPGSGTHPFSVELGVNIPVGTTGVGGSRTLLPVDSLRSVGLELPEGMVVNPRATTRRCTQKQFEGTGRSPAVFCPADSQVGVVQLQIVGGIATIVKPLYNMVPAPGVPAELAFSLIEPEVHIRGGLSGNFQLTAESTEILAQYAIPGLRVELWGNPSDSRHNFIRRGEGCEEGCSIEPSPTSFLTMPSACSRSLSISAVATGWLGSSAASQAELLTPSGDPESITGCERLSFQPSVGITTQNKAAGGPTGLNVAIKIPQNEGLFGLAAATVKRVSVQLPQGMAVNPPAADGLGACSIAEIGIGTNRPAACPDSSKVGTAEISTPLLEDPLRGSIYLAEQSNNPFGTLLALYIAVEGEGVVIKLPGRVDTDSQTGQLTATFDNNPQLPFELLNVEFTSGPRATLVTPPTCGSYNARTELTSWASPNPVVLNVPIAISENCAQPGFSPMIEAGTTNPIAGKFSPFTLRVIRADGEQNLSQIAATLPEGLLAKLAGVALCPEAQAVSGSCPSSSQVGSTTTGVGAGTQPLYIPQPGKAPTAVYLAGSYKGAPYSLVVKVPAQAGPFDLGTIAVRVALNVNPTTAQVTAASDPLPQILDGIPIAYRDVRVDVNRPDFIINPTSCEPMRVMSSITSVINSSASPSVRFQVAGCDRLTFKPKLAFRLSGPTTRGKDPALRAMLTQPQGGSNIGRVAVTLPPSLFIDQRHIDNPCTRVQFNAGGGNGEQCPSKSVLGRAKAYTPLLDRPLTGKVYFRSNGGERELPDLVASLDGQVHLNVVGFIDSVRKKDAEISRIRNTFASIPDAPVTKFILELNGGKRSILQNSTNLCKAKNLVNVRTTGQNGKVNAFATDAKANCTRKAKHRKADG